MLLIPRLRNEAKRRKSITEGETLDAARVFELVRDMQYGQLGTDDPDTTIQEWRGTSSGKHYLLKALLEELGYNVILMACAHQFTIENSPWLPTTLQEVVESQPVPDVHQFLRVNSSVEEWMTVDATWPRAAENVGLPVNKDWVPGRDMRVAADPDELFHMPSDVQSYEQARAFYESLVERELADQQQRRDLFIEDVSMWLADSLYGTETQLNEHSNDSEG